MSAASNHKNRLAPVAVRCAIYTRKSTEEGLDQEFNSLMAQRESAEAYIRSQRELGWTIVPDHYSDGGFSGGNMERPALRRLMIDVEAKRIDCVVVYKVDRLSRSLLDFASIIGLLDKCGVTFVSVTQQFNTNTSLGRLTLNILLSFAQFEREIISERTRDKVCAARRKGKWTGGQPVLGYDLDIRGGKLNVNEAEAKQVREIFTIFAAKRSLMKTLDEIEQRGWTMKSWVTRKDRKHGGTHFTRHTLLSLLTNPLYIGQVRLKDDLHAGEQTAIVDDELWRKVKTILEAEQRRRPKAKKQPIEAPLRGVLFCAGCGTPMVPAYTKRDRTRVRYYTCLAAQKRGRKVCATGSAPAGAIELAIREQLRLYRGGSAFEASASPFNLIRRATFDGRTVLLTLVSQGELADQEQISFPFAWTRRSAAVKQSKTERMPRVVRLLALAIRFEKLLADGTVKDYADLARLGRVSRARITQIMNLLNLAPDLQETLLFLPPGSVWKDTISERACRPVIQEPRWANQRQIFAKLFPRVAQSMPRAAGLANETAP